MISTFSFQDFELLEERSPALPGCDMSFKARLKVSNTESDYSMLSVVTAEDRAREEIVCLAGCYEASCGNLLDVKGHFNHDGNVYIISEFIADNSHNLREIVEERSSSRADGLSVLSADELCDLTFQLINVLAVLHALPGKEKVSHGDIRPENILFVPNDANPALKTYKLTNFNCKTLVPIDPSLRLSLKDHCEHYYAPEILNMFDTMDHGYKSCAGDIWSLGVTILNLSVGFVISRDSSLEVKTKQQTLAWRFDREVLPLFSPQQRSVWYNSSPPWVREVIELCLTCTAKDRPTADSLQDRSGYISYRRGYDAIKQCSYLDHRLQDSEARMDSLLLTIERLKEEVTAALTDRDLSKQKSMKAKLKGDKMQVERDQLKEQVNAIISQNEELKLINEGLTEASRLQVDASERQILKLQQESLSANDKCAELLSSNGTLQAELDSSQRDVVNLREVILSLDGVKFCQDTISVLETEKEVLISQKQNIQVQCDAHQKMTEEVRSSLTAEVK